jgi:arylformamidase
MLKKNLSPLHLDQRQLWDITPVANPQIAVFPGDTPFRRKILLDRQSGHHITLSALETTVHLGAHADAPNHYSNQQVGIESVDLRTYMGPAQVVDLSRRVFAGDRLRLQIADLQGIEVKAPRVLFRTGTFPDPQKWSNGFMALSSDLIHFLADKGVILVGIDTPSIDPAEDGILESHGAVAARKMAILEGLVLDQVESGLYELIALPLPLQDFDASPVRAVLVR